MDELSGLLVSGGVLLVASLFTSANSSEEEETVLTNEEKEQNAQPEKTADVAAPESAIIEAARKQFDAEYAEALNSSKVLILSRSFHSDFSKLQNGLNKIPISNEVVTFGDFNFLSIDLSSLLVKEIASEEDNLFKLLIANGLLVTPAKAFGSAQPGRFLISVDVPNDKQLKEIIDRFRNVITIAERIKNAAQAAEAAPVDPSTPLRAGEEQAMEVEQVAAEPQAEAQAQADAQAQQQQQQAMSSWHEDDEDISVSSNTRSRRKRAITDTESKRKKRPSN